jgi:hypothetical protein
LLVGLQPIAVPTKSLASTNLDVANMGVSPGNLQNKWQYPLLPLSLAGPKKPFSLFGQSFLMLVVCRFFW